MKCNCTIPWKDFSANHWLLSLSFPDCPEDDLPGNITTGRQGAINSICESAVSITILYSLQESEIHSEGVEEWTEGVHLVSNIPT